VSIQRASRAQRFPALSTPPTERHDSSENREAADNAEQTDPNEAAERIEANDPTDPIERTDLVEPIERMDRSEPIDRIEFEDLIDQIELPAEPRVVMGTEHRPRHLGAWGGYPPPHASWPISSGTRLRPRSRERRTPGR